jgi:Ty3 transposon capsid-like protein
MMLNLPAQMHDAFSNAMASVAAPAPAPVPAPTHAPPSAAGEKDARGHLPPHYDGSLKASKSIKAWLFSLRLHLAASNLNMDSRHAVIKSATFLSGAALDWWYHECMTHGGDEAGGLTTFAEFAGKLQSFNADPDPEKTARKALDDLKQTTSVLNYTQTFKSYAAQLPDRSVADNIHRFIEGLKPEVKKMVVMQNPQSLDDACLLAHQADSLHMRFVKDTGRAGASRGGPAPMELGVIHSDSGSAAPQTAPAVLCSLSHSQRQAIMDKDAKEGTTTCFLCKQKGHTKYHCPQRKKDKDARNDRNKGFRKPQAKN